MKESKYPILTCQANKAYISLDTGEIYWTSEMNPMDEDVPDDLETSDRYLCVPHKTDLDLGKRLAYPLPAARWVSPKTSALHQMLSGGSRKRVVQGGLGKTMACNGAR